MMGCVIQLSGESLSCTRSPLAIVFVHEQAFVDRGSDDGLKNRSASCLCFCCDVRLDDQCVSDRRSSSEFCPLNWNRAVLDQHTTGVVSRRFAYPALDLCSGLMKPDTHLGENARHREVSDDQATPYLFP